MNTTQAFRGVAAPAAATRSIDLGSYQDKAPDPRLTMTCRYCGALLQRSPDDSIGPNEVCLYCYQPLGGCMSCRCFKDMECRLGKMEQYTTVPGQHCSYFADISPPAPQRVGLIGMKEACG
jgi:hypothetical protein